MTVLEHQEVGILNSFPFSIDESAFTHLQSLKLYFADTAATGYILEEESPFNQGNRETTQARFASLSHLLLSRPNTYNFADQAEDLLKCFLPLQSLQVNDGWYQDIAFYDVVMRPGVAGQDERCPIRRTEKLFRGIPVIKLEECRIDSLERDLFPQVQRIVLIRPQFTERCGRWVETFSPNRVWGPSDKEILKYLSGLWQQRHQGPVIEIIE